MDAQIERVHATLSSMNFSSQTLQRITEARFNFAKHPAQSCALLGLSAFILLLPFGRLSELGIVLCLISGAIFLANGGRFRKESAPALCAALACWAAIFTAELISCIDSVDATGSLIATFGAVRFAALIIAAGQLNCAQRVFLGRLVGITLSLWCIDALVQAAFGYSLGGLSYTDRISGVFGDDNLKLGLVVPTLAPIALFMVHSFKLEWLRKKFHGVLSRKSNAIKIACMIAIWLLFATVTLLAGARAGWVMFALVSLLWGLRLSGDNLRRAGLGLLTGLAAVICLAAILNVTNSRFAQRMDRTMALFDMQTADFALAGRIPIWQTALSMAAAHPINGVGVRAFRYAYPEFANPGDPWVHALPATNGSDTQTVGASHPHQILLEILTETGLIGLALWTLAISVLVRAWRFASPKQRALAWPYGCALLVLTFPINTHTALYSSFWAGVVWWLVAVLSANLDGADEAGV